MQIYLRICPDCAKENIRESYHSKIYIPGTMDWAKDDESADSRICEIHNRGYLKLSITCDEFQILREVSNEPSFIFAMNDLKEKDLIEYNLKLAQFKAQVSQTIETEDKAKCPKCGSTDIGVANRGYNWFWGFIGSGKSMNVCKMCGHKWDARG